MMLRFPRARSSRAVHLLILTTSFCATVSAPLCLAMELPVELSSCPVSASTTAPARRQIIGQASWYGSQFANRPTASGEPFDPEKLTAAHRKLPLGTKVMVTNLNNGRSVLVTITDRGPYWANRDIDVSYRAARVLGMVRSGIATVRIEPL